MYNLSDIFQYIFLCVTGINESEIQTYLAFLRVKSTAGDILLPIMS